MSKVHEANKVKAELKAKGISLPEGFNDLPYDEQVKRGNEMLQGDERPASRGTEMKPMNEEQFAEVLNVIKELKAELRKKDADIAEITKRFDERAAASPMSQYDPNYIKMMREISRPEIKDGMVPMEYANDQDRLDEPVTFFGRKSNIRIWVVQHGGQRLTPPNGYDCVRFHNHFWYPNEDTGKPNVLCSFTTQSRLMAEFCRLDPRFGVEFFEDVAEATALNERSRWADYQRQHLMALRSKPQHEVQLMATRFGIATGSSTDWSHVLKLVAERLADQDEKGAQEAEAKMKQGNDPSVLIRHKEALMH